MRTVANFSNLAELSVNKRKRREIYEEDEYIIRLVKRQIISGGSGNSINTSQIDDEVILT